MNTTDAYYQQIHDNDLSNVLAHAETVADARRALSRLWRTKRQLVAQPIIEVFGDPPNYSPPRMTAGAEHRRLSDESVAEIANFIHWLRQH